MSSQPNRVTSRWITHSQSLHTWLKHKSFAFTQAKSWLTVLHTMQQNSNHNCNFLTGPINYTPFLVNRVHLVSCHPSHQDTKSCICECISIVCFFWLWPVSEHVTLLVFKTVDVIISIILSIQTSRLEPQTKLSLTTSTNPALPELVLLLSPFQCISQFDWPGVNVELWVVFADVGLQ